MSKVIHIADETEMIEAGRALGQTLNAGRVVALCGALGAGKTHFSKGVVSGIGADDPVSSPTFSLVNEYRSGRLPVFHFDFYRLDSAEELIRIGWDEYLDEEGVILVEWADKFPELLPDETITYRFDLGDAEERIITIS
ncbi:MAG: tRNA (adenosine(37)-N6)-threonylcarbamoyltransferase complex ATPase subunit type 1 TsaE [Verrucomicrobiales bacterium]|nr:tRNA (adenosine(37)-N6)-threonylcarbamoyltransferase complex ATPase subunit type 1 TsaE [Verrucomicrobiales bacterium]